MSLLSRAWLWCQRPDRVREAGAFAVFLSIFLTVFELLGFVGMQMGRLPAARYRDATIVFVGTIVLVSFPVFWIGLGTIARKLSAIWAGAVTTVVLVCVLQVFDYQDLLGFEFDFGGTLPTQEARSLIFALVSVLALVALLGFCAALISYYANWDLMHRPPVGLNPNGPPHGTGTSTPPELQPTRKSLGEPGGSRST
jgi:hypothetical protein